MPHDIIQFGPQRQRLPSHRRGELRWVRRGFLLVLLWQPPLALLNACPPVQSLTHLPAHTGMSLTTNSEQECQFTSSSEQECQFTKKFGAGMSKLNHTRTWSIAHVHTHSHRQAGTDTHSNTPPEDAQRYTHTGTYTQTHSEERREGKERGLSPREPRERWGSGECSRARVTARAPDMPCTLSLG